MMYGSTKNFYGFSMEKVREGNAQRPFSFPSCLLRSHVTGSIPVSRSEKRPGSLEVWGFIVLFVRNYEIQGANWIRCSKEYERKYPAHALMRMGKQKSCILVLYTHLTP